MTLRDLFGDPALPGVEVRALAYDARTVQPGDVFFCVVGFTSDGHDFAPDAVARGAVALVVQRPLGLGVPEVLVPSSRAAMAPAAAAVNGDPTAAIDVVGVTGTNGKTTTAYLTRALLEAGGRRTGLLGTVTSVVGGLEHPTVRTTPEAIDLQRTFAAMRDGGDVACAMEVSSHALALHRADAIHWAVAIFTNLSQDHLDFHDDMDDYFAAKRRLFEAGPRVAVVNVDDPYGAELAQSLPGAITVAIDAPDATLRATDVVLGRSGSTFTAGGVALSSPLPGAFNVLNALCATAAARGLGVGDDALAAGLREAPRVPGRFEPVDEGQDFALVVDYAHTPDALANVLRSARALGDGRMICVFGAGGDRDAAKRPLMGAAARELADVVIVTSDNPRSEDPEAIVAAIVDGAGPDAVVEVDRRAAIGLAVNRAQAGDVVVVAGKGHEQGQEAAGVVTPFDDVTVCKEALRARLAA
jgi:UDP-N-acetylmuramoyl-L-alanyl-D-glutamate--2,6-diaminopimelate ligase